MSSPTPKPPEVSEFDYIRDVTMRASEQHNALRLPSRPYEGGRLYYAGSAVFGDTMVRQDTVRVTGDDTLYIEQSLPDLTAEALIVGIWRKKRDDIVALYNIKAPFTVETDTRELPFRSTVADLIKQIDYPYSAYDPLTEDGTRTLFGRHTAKRDLGTITDLFRVIGVADTRVSQLAIGADTIAEPPQDGVDVTFWGPAKLRLYEDEYLCVERDKVLIGPSKENITVDITVPADMEPSATAPRLRVPQGQQATVDEEGRLITPSIKLDEYAHRGFAHNPRLLPSQAARLAEDDVIFSDVTNDFLEKTRTAILEAHGFDPRATYQRILTGAAAAIAERLTTQTVEPIAVGPLIVDGRLTEELQKFSSRARTVITLKDIVEGARK